LVFADPTHDFPRRIVYVPDDDGWHVILTGPNTARLVEQRLRYTRYGAASGS
jgi:hypothetical protein